MACETCEVFLSRQGLKINRDVIFAHAFTYEVNNVFFGKRLITFLDKLRVIYFTYVFHGVLSSPIMVVQVKLTN